jgi:uncharacterized cupredoxin-like copper-binding protein
VLLLFACSKEDYVGDAEERVKKADWLTMETVHIRMSEYEFSPSNLTFRVGQPYRLEIINDGSVEHCFSGRVFFQSIATRRIESKTDGEIKAPYFYEVEINPGRSLELYFIPVTKGRYPIRCTKEPHEQLGMRGQITIE